MAYVAIASGDRDPESPITSTLIGRMIDNPIELATGDALSGAPAIIRPSLTIDGAAGTNRILSYKTSGSNRWAAYCTLTAETGSNAGSNYYIGRYDDAGTLIGNALLIDRATGLCTIPNLDPSSVGTAIAGQNAGDLGTEAFLVQLVTNQSITAGTNYAGSGLGYFGVSTDTIAGAGNVTSNAVGATLSGTWKAKGTIPAVAARYAATIFTKVAT